MVRVHTIAFLAACLLPAIGKGQDIKLPEIVKGEPGQFVAIKAETDGKVVRWLLLDSGASLVPAELLKDSRTALVLTPNAGRFRLLAYTAKGDEPSSPAICILEIGTPVPPKPVPPPQPADPLALKLQTAFTADAGAGPAKTKQLTILYGVYAAMAEHCQTDTTLKTLGDVLTQLQKTAKDLGLVSDGLIECRKLIAAEVGALGTSPGAPFDASLRTATVACFGRIAKALEQVK